VAAFVTTKTLAKYASDSLGDFRRKIMNGYYTQEALGWTAGARTDGTLTKGIRARHALVKTAGGVRRKVIVGTDAALVAMVPGTTSIDVNINGTATAATVQSIQGEHSVGQG
jgi:hypothetical protein